MAKANHSPNFEKVRRYFERGMWSEQRVRDAVAKGWITQAECDEILGIGGEE